MLLLLIKRRQANIKKKWSKYSNLFGFSTIYKQISEYSQFSKNLRTNIQIYLCWGNVTNTTTQIIFEGHFIRIFKYSNICAHHCIGKCLPYKFFFFFYLRSYSLKCHAIWGHSHPVSSLSHKPNFFPIPLLHSLSSKDTSYPLAL